MIWYFQRAKRRCAICGQMKLDPCSDFLAKARELRLGSRGRRP